MSKIIYCPYLDMIQKEADDFDCPWEEWPDPVPPKNDICKKCLIQNSKITIKE